MECTSSKWSGLTHGLYIKHVARSDTWTVHQASGVTPGLTHGLYIKQVVRSDTWTVHQASGQV